LRHAGLDCVQISLVDTRPEKARQITGHAAPLNKIQACQWVKREGLPLTLNVVVHRHNIDHLEDMIALAERLGADRLELANTQYHGWAALNRDALLPGREQLRAAGAVARAARDRLAGTMEVVFVTPDYYSDRPRACMDGWGRRYLHVSPDGTALPCHAARSLRHLQFESVRDHTLEHIWYDSAGFNAYRGEAWMREPCRSCPERSRDFAGCRCQAFALTGDAAAADPACALSPHHHRIAGTRHDTGVQAAPVPLRLRGQRLRPGSPEADRQQVGAPEPATPAGPRAAEADRE
jgi:pyrroloquinoline quinone biosynthesis protein E